MIRVLVAEDSPVVQRTLVALLEGEDGIEVVGVADDGVQAVELCSSLKPDLVTMDVFMPGMDGLAATRAIMSRCPTRIVIISSLVNDADLNTSFEAMRAGAMEIIEKPRGLTGRTYSDVQRALAGVIRKVADAHPERVLRSKALDLARVDPRGGPRAKIPQRRPTRAMPATQRGRPQVVVLGGSSGAPAVLVGVLSRLPAEFPVPIVLAQHISRGFGRGLVRWLDQSVTLSVAMAEDGGRLAPGTVTVAPDDRHLLLRGGGGMELVAPDTSTEYTPSIDRLMSSAARAYGRGALGVLLSGMGRDGAVGLKELRRTGALTLAQDEATAVVYGIPREALESGAAERAISPTELGDLLLTL